MSINGNNIPPLWSLRALSRNIFQANNLTTEGPQVILPGAIFVWFHDCAVNCCLLMSGVNIYYGMRFSWIQWIFCWYLLHHIPFLMMFQLSLYSSSSYCIMNLTLDVMKCVKLTLVNTIWHELIFQSKWWWCNHVSMSPWNIYFHIGM